MTETTNHNDRLTQRHPHQNLFIGGQSATATDLYQLTMMYAYFAADMDTEATFEYFSRKLPRNRNFMVFAGLEQTLAYLRDLRFTGEQLDYLRNLETFSKVGDPAKRDAFFEWLRAFRFEGTVRAASEGTLFFPNEPVLQVTGSLLGCQLIETYLLSTLNYQTLIASKAARLRLVAQDRVLMEFGTRRAHTPLAGLMAARAAYVGGFDGTSNVLAGQLLGVPIVGTAAHAYTMAFGAELDAFTHYLKTYPHNTTLLIDTYDTLRGAERAASLGPSVQGIRLDSGDLLTLSKEIRAILDARGLAGTKIVASNDLNEYKIQDMLGQGAPIDIFGVGTELVTSRDDPTLSGVYKLVERYDGTRNIPTMKFSSSKPSYPGRKDLYRAYDQNGAIKAGILVQSGEPVPSVPDVARTEPMLEVVFAQGKPVQEAPSMRAVQTRTHQGLQTLPAPLRTVAKGRADYEIPLVISGQTHQKIEECQERFAIERS